MTIVKRTLKPVDCDSLNVDTKAKAQLAVHEAMRDLLKVPEADFLYANYINQIRESLIPFSPSKIFGPDRGNMA